MWRPSLPLASAVLLVVSSSSGWPQDLPSISGPAVVWRYKTGKEVRAAPIVVEGVVYCGSTNGRFLALDAGSGELRWEFQAPFPISAKAAVAGDAVLFESANILFALDRKTGTERWRHVARSYRPISSMDMTDYHRSSPVVDGAVAYYGDDWGLLNGVDVKTGALAFQYATDTGRPIRSTPAVAGGSVYFGDWEGEVYAVSLADRKLRWKHTLENVRPYYGAVVSDLVAHDGVLYFGSQHDVFTPLDLATGEPVWRFVDANQSYLPATPLVHDGKVIIASTIRTHSVICLRGGEAVWTFKGEGIFFTAPLRHGPVLLINSSNFGKAGVLYVLDIRSGSLLGRLPIEKASPSAPAVFEDKVYLGAGDGGVYALDLRALIAPAAPATATAAN